LKLSIEVPYADIDAMGHLNNVASVRYLEWARQKYWLKMRGSANVKDIDFVVARTEVDYRSSARLGEVLGLEIRVSRMGNSSFDFSYRLTGPDGRLVVEAKTTQVCYDWDKEAPKPLSAERRAEIERFEATGR
jgi:acyl-CoA thioester hydrolase